MSVADYEENSDGEFSETEEDRRARFAPWALMVWDDGDVVPLVGRHGLPQLATADIAQMLLCEPDTLEAVPSATDARWMLVHDRAPKPHRKENARIYQDHKKKVTGHCVVVQKKRLYWGKITLKSSSVGV